MWWQIGVGAIKMHIELNVNSKHKWSRDIKSSCDWNTQTCHVVVLLVNDATLQKHPQSQKVCWHKSHCYFQ
jgi:hypothetical protein